MITDKHLTLSAQRLENLRENAKISPEILSREIEERYGVKISGVQLRKYEVNTQPHPHFGSVAGMSAKVLYALADYYNVPADYILGRTDAKQYSNVSISKILGLTDETIDSLRSLMNPYGMSAEIMNSIIQKFIKTHTDYSILSDIVELLDRNEQIIESFVNDGKVDIDSLNWEEGEPYKYIQSIQANSDSSLTQAEIVDTPVIVSGHRYKNLLLYEIETAFNEIISNITRCKEVDNLAEKYYREKEIITHGNDKKTQ